MDDAAAAASAAVAKQQELTWTGGFLSSFFSIVAVVIVAVLDCALLTFLSLLAVPTSVGLELAKVFVYVRPPNGTSCCQP